MGLVLGYLSLLCLCLLLCKALTRRFGSKIWDARMLKLHRPLCAALIVLSLLHVILVVPVFKGRAPSVVMTGIALLIALVLLVVCAHRMRSNRGNMLVWHRVFSVVLLLSAVAHIATYLMDFQNYQSKVAQVSPETIEFSSLQDGVYTGEYDAGYVYAKVQITISDHKIQSIELVTHRNERGQAAEQVVAHVIEAQRFPVDTVSGATNSSKVILQAIQNACKQSNGQASVS